MPILFLVIILAGGWFGFIVYEHMEYTERRDEFIERCTDKGGVTLLGYRARGKWVGCFKAEEIENEQD